jgi:hypothetical protein
VARCNFTTRSLPSIAARKFLHLCCHQCIDNAAEFLIEPKRTATFKLSTFV